MMGFRTHSLGTWVSLVSSVSRHYKHLKLSLIKHNIGAVTRIKVLAGGGYSLFFEL